MGSLSALPALRMAVMPVRLMPTSLPSLAADWMTFSAVGILAGRLVGL